MRKKYLIIFLILCIFCVNFESNAHEYTFSNIKNTISLHEIVYKKMNSIGIYTLTGYCSCAKCCGINSGITASGTNVKQGRTIAADTSILPFGTKVYINGNIYTVEDRGGAIKNNRIDIYFDSHNEALKFGIRQQEVYLIEEEVIEMVEIQYKEYMLVTGYFLKNKIATCEYNNETNEVKWIDKKGKLVANRIKTDESYTNYVDYELYKIWKTNGR